MGAQYVHGVAFPLTDAALEKLSKLKSGALTYVQLVRYYFFHLYIYFY